MSDHWSMCCLYIELLYTIFSSLLISLGVVFYKSVTIPDNLINILQHNLDSTPIIDILFDNQCENDNTSNILGYYYGFDSGFIYNGKSYNQKDINKICKGKEEECIKFNSQPTIPYNIFKGKKICTSKRPNKNYFDYAKSSVISYDGCSTEMKNCGKLDINRYLCVKKIENCPINDIVYNNQTEYIKNDIIYDTIKINDKEYLHYTNKQNDTFIITNLTVIGGYGNSIPCGSSDDDMFYSYSSIENNQYCSRKEYNDKDYKYFFYKNLSNILLKEFYEDNKLDLSHLPEYKNYTNLGNITLFSTGYFSLSERDIKKFKGSPSNFKKNNKYSKIMSRCSLACFICIILLGVYGLSLPYFYEKDIFLIVITISRSIFVVILLIISICGLIEMIMGDKVFKLTGDFPIYYSNILEDIENPKSSAHFWCYCPFLIFEIIILTLIIIECETERRKRYKEIFGSSSNLNQKKDYSTNNTPILMETKNETPEYDSNGKYIPPTPS